MFLIISFDCHDYSFEILEWNLSKRIQFVKSNRFSFFGHGAMLSATSIIPGFTILFLPYAILGGAYLLEKNFEQRVS